MLVKHEVLAFSCPLLIDSSVFSGRGLLRMRNTMVKPKTLSLLVLLSKQEVRASHACGWWIRAFFSGRGFFGMQKTVVKPEMPSLPVLLAKWKCQHFPAVIDWFVPFPHFKLHHHVHHPVLGNRHESSNYWQESGGTSCLSRSDIWRFCPSPLLPLKYYCRHSNTNFV